MHALSCKTHPLPLPWLLLLPLPASAPLLLRVLA
jgi:hypothetical protein